MTLDPAAFVPVAVTTRSGWEESVHHGAVVAIGRDGQVVFAAGDPDVCVYARSALKPLQAAAMVECGLELEDRLLAVACASHDGRPEHVAAVEQILAGVGLSTDDLHNTPTLPLDIEAATAAVREGAGPSSVLQNCSGKHAAMLATAVRNGWPTDGYLAPDHPVQAAILAHLAATIGPVVQVGVDGCGAPAPTATLTRLATAVRRLAVERTVVHRAMTGHPEMVGGPARDVTVLMRQVPDLLVKDGAEGVQVAALPDGRAVAVKIADGAGRARTPVTVAALRLLGVDLPRELAPQIVLGHGEPVGEVRATLATTHR